MNTSVRREFEEAYKKEMHQPMQEDICCTQAALWAARWMAEMCAEVKEALDAKDAEISRLKSENEVKQTQLDSLLQQLMDNQDKACVGHIEEVASLTSKLELANKLADGVNSDYLEADKVYCHLQKYYKALLEIEREGT